MDQRSRAAGMHAVVEKYKHSFIWTPREKRPREKRRFFRKDGIQIKCFEMECEDVECICVAQAGVLCHSFISTIMNFFVHKNQICGSYIGDSEGSYLLKCDAMWSDKCVLRGRQQVSQKHLIYIYFGLHGITSKKMMDFIMKVVDFFVIDRLPQRLGLVIGG